jgi:hypothetical protein
MPEDERRQLWSQFAAAAVAGFDSDDDFNAKDVAEYGADVADELLEEYDARFGERSERPRRRRREREDRPE